jgi:hypothetical protein
VDRQGSSLLSVFAATRRREQARATTINEKILSRLGDHFALVLGDGGHDVNRQLVGVRVINGNERNAGIHQRRNEREIAGQPVNIPFGPIGTIP